MQVANGHPSGWFLRKHAPVILVLVYLFLLWGVFSVWVFEMSQHGALRQSDRVQDDGTAVTGVVTHVYNYPCVRAGGPTSCTAELTVVPADPPTDLRTTVVHDPHRSRLHSGDRVRVLVDPHDPRYAEFPERPFTVTLQWVAPLIAAIVLTTADAFFGFRLVRWLWRRRTRASLAEVAAGPQQPSDTPAGG